MALAPRRASRRSAHARAISSAFGRVRAVSGGSAADASPPQAKTGGGAVSVEVDVNAKTNFESGYWKGILDAQGKTDGGYY